MSDEIERLQQLRTKLDEEEKALGRVLVELTMARGQREEQRRRADAAEKRAQDAERRTGDAKSILDKVRDAVGLVHEQPLTLWEAVRALKTRCEGAEHALKCTLESEKGWRTRALTAEGLVAERNAEIDDARARLKTACAREQEERVLRTSYQERAIAAEREAASLRAQLDAGKQEIAGLRRSLELSMVETRAVQAEVESLRGGAEPKPTPEELRVAQNSMTINDVVLKPCPCDYCRRVRNAWIHALIASLPSPKTGRWKCRRCGAETDRADNSPDDRGWIQGAAGGWMHMCADQSWAKHGADRIGDAPEVTQ